MDQKTALVVGGAGFIGSHLVERLFSRGYNVIVVDNLRTSVLENVFPGPLSANPQQMIIVNANWPNLDKYIVEQLKVKYVDEIYYLASLPSPAHYIRQKIETIHANLNGFENILRMVHRRGWGKILYTSTSEIYGDPEVRVQSEFYNGNVSCIGERSVYDESKRMAETLCYAYYEEHGVDTHIVRIFNTYGPRMGVNDGRVIPNFIMQCLAGKPLTIYGDGKQTRSFCYVVDTVDGILLAMNKGSPVRPYNIGNPDEYMSIAELASRIKKAVGFESKNRFFPYITENDPVIRRPDISRAREELGWSPRYDLDAGLAMTIEYFKEKV